MDDDDNTKTRKRSINTNNYKKKRSKANTQKKSEEEEEEEEEECGDVEVWDSLIRSFKQVQTVLDRNRELIRRANDNHQSKIADNIAGNISLIRQINGNISKVVKIYSDLSVNFAGMVRLRMTTTPPPPATDTSCGDVGSSDS
uniref:Early flowering 4 like-1 protein n=1 Tax=Dimocarpus longan TaxID=128017 RepID=A0A0C5G7V8_9ROSI|nr:early flowering 4 like-1 protein [Dimocarpus longan]